MDNRYNDDDKRTIADMSGLEPRGLFSQWFGILDPSIRAAYGPKTTRVGTSESPANECSRRPRPWEPGGEVDLTPEERRALIKYALKYTLALAGVFILGFGILIFILTRIWN